MRRIPDNLDGRGSQTARPMLDACLKAGVHYLDITGEIDVFEALAARDAEAKAAGWSGLRTVGPVWDDQKYAYICAADGYISLSHRENFNYTLGETMAAGLPPILSAGNDLGLEFAQEGFAWQLKGDSSDELRRAVREFLDLPAEELKQRGEAAGRWAQQHLNMHRFDTEVHSLIEAVAAQRTSRKAAVPAITPQLS